MADVSIQKVLFRSTIDLHEKTEDSKKTSKTWKFIKISFPHIALGVVLMGYLFAGAFTFQFLEREDDWAVQKMKAGKIKRIYAQYADTLQTQCNLNPADPVWKDKIYRELEKLSSVHENRPFHMDSTGTVELDKIVPKRWSNQQAVLYALSILSTTGYSHVMPTTMAGQIFAMLYGLIGIPLMVLCAVDIGRFFSDIVLRIYSSLQLKYNTIRECCGFNRIRVTGVKDRDGETSELLLKKKKPSLRKTLLRVSDRKMSSETSQSPDLNEDKVPKKKRVSIVSLVTAKHSKPSKKLKKQTKKPPLWAIFGILLIFLTLGGIAYIFYSVHDPWTAFVEGVFNAFNLIANLTMGEVPGEYDAFTVCYIVFFVTFGLAVLTMCADLAASHLKWLFMKIHYFGRQIQRHRKKTSPEVKELLEIIKQIRKEYPEKETITFQDILEYMEEHGNVFGLSRSRRNTIAYQPNLLDTIQFADDEEGMIIRNRSPTPANQQDHLVLAMAFKDALDGIDSF